MAISENALKATLWRAHHRGTREADMVVGGFADRWLREMTDAEFAWFEKLLDEQDVDILAWALGTAAVPAELQCEMMDRLIRLDYVKLAPR